MENRKTVVLQSHIDMVCEKNNDVQHDFLTDPIETVIEGEWLRAKGTTLGADNGIGVATELAILADNTLQHGPIECLFTVDEETGLTGAFALKEGFMNGDILLNLDSEDEGELFIGCAGGVDSVAEFTYKEVDVPAGYFFCKILVKGLKGGHSGGDIHLQRGNANKILNRFLSQTFQKYDMYLCEIDGGNLRNAIAREAHAIIALPEEKKHDLRADLNIFRSRSTSRICRCRSGLATDSGIGRRPRKSHRQRDNQTPVAEPVRLPARCLCHEPGHPGTGGNVHQPCVGENETGKHDTRRNQPAQLHRLFQGGYRQHGAHRVRHGRRQGILRRWLSGMETESTLRDSGDSRGIVQTPVRHGRQSESYTCRTGMRTVPRQISVTGHDFLRSYPARSPFAG